MATKALPDGPEVNYFEDDIQGIYHYIAQGRLVILQHARTCRSPLILEACLLDGRENLRRLSNPHKPGQI